MSPRTAGQGHAPDREPLARQESGGGEDGEPPVSREGVTICWWPGGTRAFHLERAARWPLAAPAKCHQPALPGTPPMPERRYDRLSCGRGGVRENQGSLICLLTLISWNRGRAAVTEQEPAGWSPCLTGGGIPLGHARLKCPPASPPKLQGQDS